jgi:hypothetical protein
MIMQFDYKIEKEIDTEEQLHNMQKALYAAMVKMKELAIRKAPTDMGLLRNSISIIPNTTNSNEYVLQDGVSYGVYMEFGTSPHWAPIQPLKEWAQRHSKDVGFAYALRQKIKNEGVDAHPFFRPALEEVKKHWLPLYMSKYTGEENV